MSKKRKKNLTRFWGMKYLQSIGSFSLATPVQVSMKHGSRTSPCDILIPTRVTISRKKNL